MPRMSGIRAVPGNARVGAPPTDPAATVRLLVQYATLAPSSHNSQPWRFRVSGGRIDLLADPGRWLPVADANRRELHLSLGAALENLLLAAEHCGFGHDLEYFPEPARPDWIARVELRPDGVRRPLPLFPALPIRRTNRRPYCGEVDAGLLQDLVSLAWDPGIWAWASAEAGDRERVAELVARGDRIEYADPAFRRELGEWIRRGLLGLRWPLAGLYRFLVTRLDLGRRMASRDAALVRGSGAVLVLVSKADDALTQVRTGQAMERVWLLATQLGLAIQPMSQPLELPELRRELAALIGAGEAHPQHLFRIGHAEPETRHAPRRPLDDVIVR